MQTYILNPLDSRYRNTTESLAAIFSEQGFFKYRTLVEVRYFIMLSESEKVGLRKLTMLEKDYLESLCDLSQEDYNLIKQIELQGYGNIPATKHDLKALEYFLKIKLKNTTLADTSEWVHFALTTWDITSVAYGLMLSDAISKILLPKLAEILEHMQTLAKKHARLPMLARTHGQPASPTTMGKQCAVFAERLSRQIDQLKSFQLLVKFSGATGNYNAHYAAYPTVDWVDFSEKFISSFNTQRHVLLSLNNYTTQIEPNDTYAELCDILKRIHTILLNINQDMWRYISDGWVKQKQVAGEIGSSAMPHKVNPINFENSEGNLGLANAILSFFSSKLPISRLQRDLSDSSVQRNFGVAFGYALVAYEALNMGLSSIEVDELAIVQALREHPEVIAEGIQTILRREGVPMPYEQLKALTRGKTITLAEIHTFIDNLDIPSPLKVELKKLDPVTYIGNSAIF
ncbi:MAG TPA: adenylosuccinate lyase [Patescibacteria group bacterium]|nr:adenylosuccinate lyase [Patescibacteria group bacterium]